MRVHAITFLQDLEQLDAKAQEALGGEATKFRDNCSGTTEACAQDH